jgi:hypothetical protein
MNLELESYFVLLNAFYKNKGNAAWRMNQHTYE